MEELSIRIMSINEAQKIYREHMTKDFPDSERKPFSMIREMMEEGAYRVYAAFEGQQLLAYAFMALFCKKDPPAALLDYFAVCRGFRCRGTGSRFLKALQKEAGFLDYIVIESEAVDRAGSEEEKGTRKRRIAFYKRIGAVHTRVRTMIWHVEYEILVLGRHDEEIPDTLAYRLTEEIYHQLLPEEWFGDLAWIRFKNE